MAFWKPSVRKLFFLLLYCGYLMVAYLLLVSYEMADTDSEPRGTSALEQPRPEHHAAENQQPSYVNCTEKTNLVYVKMIKCASETLTSIFRRFGYTRHLDFVLPVGNRIYLGWPHPLGSDNYRPLKGEQFNIMCDHVVFNKRVFQELMPRDTVYVTSLREPYSQFKSMFHYYNLKNIADVHGNDDDGDDDDDDNNDNDDNNDDDDDDPVTQYLQHLQAYETKYKSHDASPTRYCIPDGFSMSKNLMSFNLGFPTGSFDNTPDFSADSELVSKWLSELEETFDLVIISEYLPESLVLLKRKMCWDFVDILHLSHNVGHYSYKDVTIRDNVEIYRNWSRLDHVLYDRFNRTLWKKIETQGLDFWQEVTLFKTLLQELATFCNNGEETSLAVPNSPWNAAFTLTKEYCRLLTKGFLKELQQEYDKRLPDIQQPKPKNYFC